VQGERVELPPLYRRSRLLAAGYSDVELRRLLRTGELTPVRRGAYLDQDAPTDTALRHAVAARAALPQLGDRAVFSHVTAAVLHGLPVWNLPLEHLHATRSRRGGGRCSRAVLLHSAGLDPQEIDTAAGLPVTCLARTVADLARTVSFEAGVAVADAALHGDQDAVPRRQPVQPAELAAALARAARWPGAPAARRVIAFADGRSGSVGESRSRVALHRNGLPTPLLQWEVTDRAGRFIGYVDFGWPAQRTVGEFDGRIKYGRSLNEGKDPGEVVFAEKLREDRLRDQDLAVVRWTWADLAYFAPVADRIRSRLARSAARRSPR
jgi:hypothetical protein